MKNTAKQITTARAISEFGNSLRYIALPLGIIAIRKRPHDIVLAEVLETLGFLISGFLSTFFIDRLHKMKALILSDLLSVAVTAFLVYGLWKHSLVLLLTGSFLMTFIDTFYSGSLGAVTADLSEANGDENALRSMIRGFSALQFYTLIGGMVGTVIGGQLVKAVPFYGLMFLDGLSFLVSSFLLFRALRGVDFRFFSTAAKKAETFAHYVRGMRLEFIEGFRATFSNVTLRNDVLSQGLVGMAHGLLSASVIAHLKTHLKVSNSQVSYSQLNNRVWTAAGSYFRLRTGMSLKVSLLLGAGVMCIGYFGMGFFPFYGFLCAYGLQQFGNSILTPTNRAMIMAECSSEVRGRVSAFRGLAIDIGVLSGNLGCLALIGTFGSTACFVAAGVLVTVVLGIVQRRKE